MKNFGGERDTGSTCVSLRTESRDHLKPPLFLKDLNEAMQEEMNRDGDNSGDSFLRTQLEYEGTIKLKSWKK